MYKLFASAIFAAFLSTNSYGATFLSDSESDLIPATERPAGLVVVKEAFEKHSETPALVLSVQNVYGHELMVVERDGVKAFLVDKVVFDTLLEGNADAPTLRSTPLPMARDPDSEGSSGGGDGFCSSSCWDDAFGGAVVGAGAGGVAFGTIGATIGGGAGFYVAGPPGAAGGAAMGGAIGATGGVVVGGVAGGIQEYNKCEQAKAEKCSE